jgi:hypothetical protein
VYIGAPFDSTYVPQAGSVDHLVNQSRVYGVTTSTVANPALIPGNSIRVNDIVVVVPDVPNNTVAGLAAAINAAGIPNVTAATTTDLIFTGDGETQSFNIGNLYSDAASYTPVVLVNNNLQTLNTNYTYNPNTEQISFLIAPAPASTIRVVSGRITVSVINSAAATPQNMLTVLPNSGPAFATLGFNTFVLTQQIVSPAPSVYAQFGASISVDSSAANLIIGAPNGNVNEPTTFDAGRTYFDERSTTVFNPVLNAGVAYT